MEAFLDAPIRAGLPLTLTHINLYFLFSVCIIIVILRGVKHFIY